jgi:hypothetical protein
MSLPYLHHRFASQGRQMKENSKKPKKANLKSKAEQDTEWSLLKKVIQHRKDALAKIIKYFNPKENNIN